jgi:Family of unknown function (DUF6011)
MLRWKWVRHGTEILRNVGVLADGSLHNPNGYPDDAVRAACQEAEDRWHERRRRAAAKAVETRRLRQEKRISAVRLALRAGKIFGPRSKCVCCARRLSDPESIARGIGSECWQHFLTDVTARASTPPVLV